MSDISFENNNQIRLKNIASLSQKESKGIINFLINKGIVKDVKGANVLLTIMFILLISLSIYIYIYPDININRDENLKQIELNKIKINEIKSKNQTR